MRLPMMLVVLALLLGCAPTNQAPRAEGAAPGTRAPGASKVLVMGRYSTNEPSGGVNPFGTGGSAGGADFPYIFHAGLTLYDPSSTLLPWMASKVPTVEYGDWAVFPDGHMEVTWTLRPESTWHDGTPL